MNVADIVLTTLNAKYIHAAFGLRYLLANLGELQPRACLAEFDINQRPLDIAGSLLARNPKIIGFGVYIWNVEPTTEVIAAIKRVRPDIKIILGGPEVSYETEASHRPTGRPCHHRRGGFEIRGGVPGVAGCRAPPGPDARTRPGQLPKIIPAGLPDFSQLVLPYDLYTDDDIAHRIIYVEASRGCPFTCEFCLSSLDIPVRQVPLPALLGATATPARPRRETVQVRGPHVQSQLNVSKTILEFFLARYQPGHFFHFEMVPDRLPAALREVIARFPPGALQFEVGIQTFNPEVGAAHQPPAEL